MHIFCKHFLLPFLLGGPPTSGTLRYRTAASKSAQLPSSPRHSFHNSHYGAHTQEVLHITGSQHTEVQFYGEETASDRIWFCPKSAVSVSSPVSQLICSTSHRPTLHPPTNHSFAHNTYFSLYCLNYSDSMDPMGVWGLRHLNQMPFLEHVRLSFDLCPQGRLPSSLTRVYST